MPGPIDPRLDPRTLTRPLAQVPPPLARQRADQRMRVARHDRPDGRRAPVQLEQEQLRLDQVGQVHHLLADGLRGGLQIVPAMDLADRPGDQGPLPAEGGRAALQRTRLGDVALAGDVPADRAMGVADGRDDRRLRDHRAVLAAVDQVTRPWPAARERRPHGLVERRRLGAALEDPGVLADDLVTGIAGGALEGRVDVGDPSLEIGDLDRLGRLLDGRGEPVVLRLRSRVLGQVQADAPDDGPPVLGRQRELHDDERMGAVVEGPDQGEHGHVGAAEGERVDLVHARRVLRRPDVAIGLAVPLGSEARRRAWRCSGG